MTSKKKAPKVHIGRKALPERQRLKVRSARFSDQDWSLIRAAAKIAGFAPLSYVRIAVITAAAKLIARAKGRARGRG